MRFLAPLIENPWCLLLALLVASLIIGGAGFVALFDRRARRPPAHAPRTASLRRSTGSAPIEGLAVLHEHLLTIQRHLRPGSDDARWLGWFIQRLRQVMDEASTRLANVDATEHGRLLDRLRVEVEALAGVVNLQLGATLTRGTDRQALEAQLAALRDTIER